MHPQPALETVAPIGADEWTRAARPADEAGFGALASDRGQLPLEAMDVRAAVCGLGYQLRLRQRFVNNLGGPIEASYVFPLPDRGAVTEFRLRVADREIEGEIQERGAARRVYSEAIAAGHRAAIAEEERSGVFTMRVGNIPAGERATVEMTVIGSLELEEGAATFRFPLVVAPRYIPGRPLDGASVGEGIAPDTDAVPDASRITPPVLLPGYPNPVRLALRVDIDPAGLPIDNLRCALHAAVIERGEGGAVAVELRPGERLDRDFVLRFDLGDDAVTTAAIASPDSDGEGGTFAVTLLPPRGAVAAARPRDVVFVLDRSGSMDGWKMIAARRAVARMIDSLDSRDRFAVLAFDNSIETPPALGGELRPGSDRNRFRAVEFLAGLEARGGTEMLAPLVRAAELLGGGYRDRERVLVLATDGQVGNEDQILSRLDSKLGARIFTVGIDRAVNEGFLRRLAILGAGASEIVESEDRLDEVMDRLHRRIGEPVITELAVAGEGLDIDAGSLVPRRLPDLFAGSPVVVRGRYRGRAGGKLVLTGADGGGERYRRELVPRVAGSESAAPLWARGRLRDLEDRYAIARGKKSDLAAEIVALSLRHKVLCRFTAFVAVDRAEVVNPGGEPERLIQPVELPDGWTGGPASGAVTFAADELAEAEAAPRAAPMSPMMIAPAPMSASFAPGGAAPPPPPAPKAQPAGGLRQRVSRLLSGRAPGRRQASEGAAWSDPSSIRARLEDLARRHRGRSWLAPASRVAHLARDLERLAADLERLGAPATWRERIAAAAVALRALGGADPLAEADRILGELARELGAPADAGTDRGERPFWR